MVIIELLTFKLALDGILQNINEIAGKDDVNKSTRMLKSQLSKLMIDFENGVISQEDFEKGEREVLSKLNDITR
jgi:hypothetical protein